MAILEVKVNKSSCDKLKILHISTVDKGGAYKSAFRLCNSMIACGMESSILVRTKLGKDDNAFEAFSTSAQRLNSKIKNGINLILKRSSLHIDYLGSDLTDNQYIQEADVIVVHWINSFLSPKNIAKLCSLNKPTIWVLHDMWPFTGGCHVSLNCERYRIGCGKCPQINSEKFHDITFRYWAYKQKYLSNLPITFVGPSRWIVQCAKESMLVYKQNIKYIPNAINTDLFKPIILPHKEMSAKKVILFGAADNGSRNKNKGFSFLIEAVKKLSKEKYSLAIFGSCQDEIAELIGYDIHKYGFVTEEKKLVEIYNNADVFVNPSLQESFGYTVCEAMSCGTPVVAFAVGGHLDQIEHKKNGYLVKVCDIDGMAQGIEYCIEHHEQLGRLARESAQKFSYTVIGEKYKELCLELINK